MPSGAQLAVLVTRAVVTRAAGRLTRPSAQQRDRGPAGRLERALATGGYRGLQLSLLISIGLVFGLVAATTQSVWLAGIRIGLGLALIAEGYVLGTNWRRGRGLIVWRLQHGPSRGTFIRSTAVRHLLDFGLQLAGVIWLAAGGYLVWLGVVPLV